MPVFKQHKTVIRQSVGCDEMPRLRHPFGLGEMRFLTTLMPVFKQHNTVIHQMGSWAVERFTFRQRITKTLYTKIVKFSMIKFLFIE